MTNTIIIISGLPRTGTSMMMQMLKAGGITLTEDSEKWRPADSNNPNGYFEYFKERFINIDTSFLNELPNNGAIKIVAPDIMKIPLNIYSYKVIYMQRTMSEVYQSWATLTKSQNVTEDVQKTFTNENTYTINWFQTNNIPTLQLNYGNVLNNPSNTASQINTFLGISGLNLVAMANAINPSLYKSKGN